MNEFCPNGHELNGAGVCPRDGYQKPAEALADIVDDVEVEVPVQEEVLTDEGKVEAEASSAPSNDSSEVSEDEVVKIDAQAGVIPSTPDNTAESVNAPADANTTAEATPATI